MKRFNVFLITLALFALCASPGYALDYSFDAPEDYLYGQPTNDDTVYEWENPNQDRSKNTALIPPGFGTPTSYLRGSGEYLTPNLAPGAMSGGLVNAVGGNAYTDSGPGGYPAPDTSISAGTYPPAGNENFTTSTIGYTDVTSDLYYSGGHLGTLKIPSLGVNVKIYEGTDSAQLAKGAGHFTNTSIWNGNVCLAGHNRGVTNHFGKIHTLNAGDTITLTTQLGTRTYSVTSVTKVSETDTSGTAATSSNQITLYTCVMNESAYRWCVVAQEV